ncbi:hypothetical protein HanRHA438_Chr02g0092481 [Helianthus annuus]|nr:hypothetical protein HanRHA438_Chr02g0092481 [Helianthus annuus]
MLDGSSRLDSMGTEECVVKVDNMLVIHKVVMQVELSHEDAELRLLGILINHKINKVFEF